MLLEIIIAILLALGIILTALPTVPGMGYMLVVTIIYGFVDTFEHFDPWWLALFFGLTLLGIVTDHASGLMGAKFGGASKNTILLGLIGMLIGLVLFPPLGLFLGLFLGVFIGGMLQFNDHRKALKAASYSFMGTVTGMILNVLIAIGFFVSFLILVF
jgi:uncharacterized protein